MSLFNLLSSDTFLSTDQLRLKVVLRSSMFAKSIWSVHNTVDNHTINYSSLSSLAINVKLKMDIDVTSQI